MYWLQRPGYARRIGAIALIVTALAWDLSEGATAPYPIAARSIAAGDDLTAEDVGWVDLPSSVLPTPNLEGATAAVDIHAGEALTSALLSGPVEPPQGWWVLPIVVGTLAVPGDEALLVVADPPTTVVGLVLEPQVGDPYDLDHRPAAVAVPPQSAPVIAAAQQQGLLITAVRPSGIEG